MSIVFDFEAINKAMHGDDWFDLPSGRQAQSCEPNKKLPVPCTTPFSPSQGFPIGQHQQNVAPKGLMLEQISEDARQKAIEQVRIVLYEIDRKIEREIRAMHERCNWISNTYQHNPREVIEHEIIEHNRALAPLRLERCHLANQLAQMTVMMPLQPMLVRRPDCHEEVFDDEP